MPSNFQLCYVGVDFNYKYPFIYLLAALIVGILFDIPLTVALYCFFSGLVLVSVSFFFHLPALWREIFIICTVIACGFVISAPTSFTPDPNTIYFVEGRCHEILPNNNYILSTRDQKYYLNHFYTDTTYNPGDSLHFQTYIYPFRENANPGEFSYTRYLKQKNVNFRLLPVSTILQRGHSENLHTYFDHIRSQLMLKTHQLFPDTTCCRLINALCLGYKNDLDSEVEHLFISTGTVHLLSVSGLHTGAIYLLLLFMFQKLGFTPRKITLSVLPFLWGYACLTGLSPSVVRAATILSFINIGQFFNKSYTPLNSVAAAAFLTLLFHPSNLYSLSFLLSYSAYTGILTIYPFLHQLADRFPFGLAKIYACCCITIAAQLPTLPISAYYFHTININGFLANIIAVPLATLLLYSSAICLLLPALLSQYLTLIPEMIENILIGFLRFFTPYSINIKNLYPHFLTILFIYISLITLCLHFSNHQKRWRQASILSLGILLCWSLFYQVHLASKQEIIVFHLYRESAILLNYRGYYTYLLNTSDSSTKMQPYIFQNQLRSLPIHQGILHPSFTYSSYQLCTLTDTITIAHTFPIPPIKGQLLIVTNNLTPEKIFHPEDSHFPAQIVLDGSHSPAHIRLWEKFCHIHQLTLFNTAESGSFRIPLP